MAMASSSSATVAVEKATSDLLMGPDWTMNIDICDSVNSNHWLGKDVVKAVKKRLQHKNPRVQLLALTLLETMIKNCGESIHFQIAEKNILGEMVRIIKKKTDMHVRDKILLLLDSWQEAFGGPGGKHPQYYWAYEELRRSGVGFPQRSSDAAPIFTPPVTHSTLRHAQAGYGMPSNSSRRLDETMAAEAEGLSLASLESMRNVSELLGDMLQAVNLDDRTAVKDELIVDLVSQCRSNQKKLMQMLTTTGDEELLGRGLELNDGLQIVLAKHDAIASGSPLPTESTNLELKPLSNTEPKEAKDSESSSSAIPVANVTRSYIDEEDEEEDDFAQLARRHSKTQSSPPQSSFGTSHALVPVDASNSTPTAASTSTPATSNASTLFEPAAPARTTKEQDIIDLLTITLSTSTISPEPNTPQVPASGTGEQQYISQTGADNQGQAAYNNYVVPWAHPHSQNLQPQQQFQHQKPHPQSHPHPQHQEQFQTQSYQQQFQSQSHPQSHAQPQFQSQSNPQSHAQPQQQLQPQSPAHVQPQFQQQFQPQTQTQPPSPPQQFPQLHHQPLPQQQYRQPQQQPHAVYQHQYQPQQSQYPQYTSAYPPPPWAATPGYAKGQSHMSATNNMYSTLQANTGSSYAPAQVARPMQHYNSFPARGTNVPATNDDSQVSSAPSGQKTFVPSYRLFEDLNVFGDKIAGGTSPNLSGPSSQGMVGGRK